MSCLESIPIAELEEFGCPVTVINSLEERAGIIWLSELLRLSPEQLSAIPQIGSRRLGLIINAIRRHREVHGWGRIPHINDIPLESPK